MRQQTDKAKEEKNADRALVFAVLFFSFLAALQDKLPVSLTAVVIETEEEEGHY